MHFAEVCSLQASVLLVGEPARGFVVEIPDLDKDGVGSLYERDPGSFSRIQSVREKSQVV